MHWLDGKLTQLRVSLTKFEISQIQVQAIFGHNNPLPQLLVHGDKDLPDEVS